MIPIEHLLLGAAFVLLLSILASKVAVRAGVPALLLFIGLGMLAGSEGIGRIPFDDPWTVQAVGVVALAFILFAGGMDTRLRSIRPILREGIALATIGVAVTALAVGVFTHLVFGFSLAEGALLGAIISSTDAAAVFSVLRGKDVHLKRLLKPLLELESGSNDPMAVFLTIGLIALVKDPAASPLNLIPAFFLQMGIGAVVGIGVGRLMQEVINRVRLEYDGLYPVLTIAAVALTYGAAAALNGNGFLAVYLAGVVMGNGDFIHKRSLIRFHDGLAWLMQILMFLTLGLQVFPSKLIPVAGEGLLIALFLILAARPAAVFISLIGTPLMLREKLYIAFVGLRGAAPIILATFPLLAGLEKAETIFNIVFFIVLTSVLLQGTLIVPMAKWLGVYSQRPLVGFSPLAYVMEDGEITDNIVEATVMPNSHAVGKQILDLHLPPGVLIALIGRDRDVIVPNGGTVIEAGDHLLLVTRPEVREELITQLCGASNLKNS
jgi:cell volume regulation protein A